jgi:hypothetical protein
MRVAMLAFAAVSCASAGAQVAEVSRLSETDLALSIYGAFNEKTTGDGIVQSPSNAAGVIV